MTAAQTKVGIIGAGAGGLVSARWALKEGLDVTILERSNTVGGLWRPGGHTWPTMRTNVSKFCLSFMEFNHEMNPTEEALDPKKIFLTAKEMYEYLLKYADNFNITPHVLLGHEVIEINQSYKNEKPGWKVKCRLMLDQTDKTKVGVEDFYFDKLIVASGNFSQPFIPLELKEIIDNAKSKFAGTILHSIEYPSLFKNQSEVSSDKGISDKLEEIRLPFSSKNLLVIGNSNSSSEIIPDLAGVNKYNERKITPAKKIYHLIRRPRYNCQKLSPAIGRGNKPFKLPVDFLLCARINCQKPSKFDTPEERKMKYEFFSSMCCDQKKVMNAQLVPEFSPEHLPFFYATESFLDAAKCGIESGTYETLLGEKIKEITGNEVKFESGRSINCDMIIMCTGFAQGFEILFEPKILDCLEYEWKDNFQQLILYKGTFRPGLENLAFIGMFQNTNFPLSEVQARWAAKVFAKKISFPNEGNPEVLNYIEEERAIRATPFAKRSITANCDFPILTDSIAREFGACPDLNEMKGKDPELYEQLMNQPFLSCHFALVGPDASPEWAKMTINTVKQYSEECKRLPC